MQNNMLRTACRQYAPYRMQNNALRASQGFFIFFLLKTLIMQKFKLSWMALLRNERDSWGNWNKQGKWSKPGVQNEKGSDKYKESCAFFNSRTPTK